MKQSYHFLLAGLVALLLLLNCKKQNGPDAVVQNVSFSRHALEYVNLVPGKYLIYKDSASTLTDSVVVTKSLLENKYHAENTSGFNVPAYNGEEFSLTLSTKTSTGASSLWFQGSASVPFNSYPFISSDTALLYLAGSESNIISRVFSQNHSYHSTETTIIEGKTYNGVVTDINDSGLDINNPNYRKTIYSWAKGVGIIKRTIITTGGAIKTYALLRNN